MKKQKIQLRKNTAVVVFGSLLFLLAGIQQTSAQTSSATKSAKISNYEIPAALISATKYEILKSVEPSLSFDETTPYFEELTIVDASSSEVQKVISTNINASDNTIERREFDFSRVPPGTYYAKGLLTGALVYYQIVVKN